jgi:hypothetical protein
MYLCIARDGQREEERERERERDLQIIRKHDAHTSKLTNDALNIQTYNCDRGNINIIHVYLTGFLNTVKLI